MHHLTQVGTRRDPRSLLRTLTGTLLLSLTLVACAPAAPPAATATTAPAAKPAAPVAAASPSGQAAAPASSPSVAAKPAASPASSPSPAGVAPSPAAAATFNEQAVADFYRGKTVRIVVGSAAGGGYDTYARLIARYLGKYIPGTPTIVVENAPGAGSVLAMKQVYSNLPKDGTVIGSIIGSTVSFDQLFSNPTDYDMTKVAYLGAPVGDKFALFVASRSGVTNVDDMIGPNAKPITTGSNASSGDMGTATAVYFDKYLGAKIKNVTGYGGTAQVRLAVDSGELDGMVNSWQSHLATTKEKVDSGEWHVMAQLTMEPIPNGPSGVPTLADLAKTQEQRDVARLYTLPNDYARPFFVAPGVPDDRVAALRQAFSKALDDSEFRAEAQKSLLDVAPISGERLQTMISEFLSVPEATKAQLKAVLAP